MADEPRTTTVDLREPTTPQQLDPDGPKQLTQVDGPVDVELLLPDRTITGRYRDVILLTLSGPAGDPPGDDPAWSIDRAELKFEFTDDPDEVIAQIERALEQFDVTAGDRAAIDEFVSTFRSTTDAADGEIRLDDFELDTGGHIRDFPLFGGETTQAQLSFRAMGGGDAVVTLSVRWDNGVE